MMPWNFEVPLDEKATEISEFLQSEGATREKKMILLAIAISELRDFEGKAYRLGRKTLFKDYEEKILFETYFDAYLEGFEEFQFEEEMAPYYWMLQNLFKDVFVEYHISKDFSIIYQGCDLYCFSLTRGDTDWKECDVKTIYGEEYAEISREEAEVLNDEWVAEVMDRRMTPLS